MPNTCITCDKYDTFLGVCFNGDSEWCADTPPFPETEGCGCWEQRKEGEENET